MKNGARKWRKMSADCDYFKMCFVFDFLVATNRDAAKPYIAKPSLTKVRRAKPFVIAFWGSNQFERATRTCLSRETSVFPLLAQLN